MLWHIFILSLLGFECWAILENVITPTAKEQLISNILRSQNPKTGLFDSLVATHHTVEYFAKSGRPIPKSTVLCDHIKSVSAKNWEEFQFLLATRARLPKCLKTVTENTRDKLKSGFSAKKLSSVFYAVNAQAVLVEKGKTKWNPEDLKNAATQLLKIQSKDGLFGETAKSTVTAHKTALALKTLSRIIPAIEESSRAPLVKAGKTAAVKLLSKGTQRDNLLVFQDSLTVTTHVLEGLYEFGQSLREINEEIDLSSTYTAEVIDQLANFFLQTQHTIGAGASRQVLSGLDILSSTDSLLPTPLSIRCENFVQSSDGSSEKFAILISGIDGQKYNFGDKKVSITFSATKVGDETKKVEAVAMQSGDGMRYVGDIVDAVGATVNDLGQYSVQGKATVGSETSTIETQVKVVTQLGKSKLSYGFGSDKNSAKSISYPKQVEKGLQATPSKKLRFEVSVESEIRPFQAYMEFRRDNHKMEFPLSRKKNVFSLTVNVGKKQFGKLLEGAYDLSVIIGDIRLKKGLSWNLGSITIVPPEDHEKKPYEPVNDEVPPYKPKEAISHTFAGDNPAPYSIFPMIFVVILGGALFMWFVVVLVMEGITFEFGIGGKAMLSAILFVVSLFIMVAVLGYYFLEYNIFEAGFRLAAAGSLAFVSGYNVLKAHVAFRTGGHKKNE